MYRPGCVSDGSEDAEVAEDDDEERDEEDKDKEQHGVGTDRRSKCHVIPGTRRHQTFWDISTCGRAKYILLNRTISICLGFHQVTRSRAL